jgi:hypothetical protein
MKIESICEGVMEDDIGGVGERDHTWVEQPTYIAPNPADGQPAAWHDLACEKCGIVQPNWERLASPI